MSSASDDSDSSSRLIDSGLAIASVLTGVPSLPAPIRQNAFKAFSQLLSSVTDVPIAYFEGIAAEKRAGAAARVKLISAQADKMILLAKVDPEFVLRAGRKAAERIIREQVNLDAVCQVAADELLAAESKPETEPQPEHNTTSISDDFLGHLEDAARHATSDEVRLRFGKLLAGEITKPSSFSVRTVKRLAEMDDTVAVLFARLCSCAISLQQSGVTYDNRVATFGKSAADNGLQEYALSFSELNKLQEYGLIISDYNSHVDYQSCIANSDDQVEAVFCFQNSIWGLVPENNLPKLTTLRINGVMFSQSGSELRTVVNTESSDKYHEALRAYFKSLNLVMMPVSEGK